MYVVVDTEVYPNYFLATFLFEDGRIFELERWPDQTDDIGPIVREIMRNGHTLITFNGIRYDMPILSMAVAGATNAVLKEASDKIIQRNNMPWHLERHYHFSVLQIDHIDIINLLPLFESLKLYSARIHAEHLQDLPFEPDDFIDAPKAKELREYCLKDCTNTWALFVDRWEQIKLREALGAQYDLDLRSKSDAQIAEAVIKSEYERMTGTTLRKPLDTGALPEYVTYELPHWANFSTPEVSMLAFMLHHTRFDLADSGKPEAPKWLKGLTVNIDDKEYAVGLGGLHSKNKSESYWADNEYKIIDLDVTSYYPSIILNQGYQPPHMGKAFTEIFRKLVDKRVAAKKEGMKVTADTLKITINGTFGKLGSKYSAIYAPQLLLAVTFSGQLALLMLIEMLAQKGIQCVSANTDGVTVKVASKQLVTLAVEVERWETMTGFKMESTSYKSIHYRDVNNYFAMTKDGELKTKGVFKSPDVWKNPAAPIISHACMDHVLYGTPVWEVIDACDDIRDFLHVRTVKGGAAKDGEYLGKAIRWYYSRDTETEINYISNGNKVAKSDASMPMMDLVPGIPDDLDVDRYVEEAEELVELVGYESPSWL